MLVFKELNRRNIFRVALLYVLAAWLILQLTDVLFALLSIPAWTFRFIFALLVICFPLALVFSWLFELTPQGIKREQDIDAQVSITTQTGHKLNRLSLLLLALNVVVAVLDKVL